MIPKILLCLSLIISFGFSPASYASATETQRPNVLFISVDDLNDWTGFMKGHPQALTPNMDKFAKRAVSFAKAHCASPACNPSRTAMLTGISPSSSGLYFNKLQTRFRQSNRLRDEDSLPNWFRKHGYTALGSGKVFHKYQDRQSWDAYYPPLDEPTDTNRPPDALPSKSQQTEMRVARFKLGPMDIPREEMGDWKVAEWIASQLKKDWNKPFFIACGIFRPHLPLYAPKEYFDRFPLEEIQLPEVLEGDLTDVPRLGARFAFRHTLDEVLDEAGTEGWKKLVQAYLACTSFADDCVGHVLDALERSPYRDNTIVVLVSDHGWHLGEKNHTQKFTLWERATRSVCVILAPDVSKAGAVFHDPVSLLDLFPTLCDLAGIESKTGLDGESLVEFLKDPSRKKKSPAITTWEPGNHAVRSTRWRYIRYADGSEELYDHFNDGKEWHNLADDTNYAGVIAEHVKWLPEEEAAPDPAIDTEQRKADIQKLAIEKVDGKWVRLRTR